MANNTSFVATNQSRGELSLTTHDESESEREAAEFVWIIGGSILMIVGTAGNIMAFAVLIRPNLRRSNAALYLIVVAVSDLGVLYTGLLRQIILINSGKDVREESELGCKFHSALLYFFLDFSAWLLAALTMERLFSVCWPHRIRNICTRKTSICVISGIAVVLFGFNLHFFFIFGSRKVRGKVHNCLVLTKEYYEFYTKAWPWMDLGAFALLPLTVQIICNTFIVKRVVRSFQESRRESREAGGSYGGGGASGRGSMETAASRHRGGGTPTNDQTAHGTGSGDGAAVGHSWKSLDSSSAAGGRGAGGGERKNTHQAPYKTSHNRAQASTTTRDNLSGFGGVDGLAYDPELSTADTAQFLKDNRLILSSQSSAAGAERSLPSSPSHPPTSPLLDHHSGQQQQQQPALISDSQVDGIANITNAKITTTGGSSAPNSNNFMTAGQFSGQSQHPNPDRDLAYIHQQHHLLNPNLSHHHHHHLPHPHSPHHRHADNWDPAGGARNTEGGGRARGGGRGGAGSGGGAAGGGRARVSSMTLMLVTVSTVYCLTTLPVSIFFVTNWIFLNQGYEKPHRQLAWAVVSILMYTNNTVNFILYSLSGSRFRAELFAMARAIRKRLPRPFRVRRSGSAMMVTSRSTQSSLSQQTDKAKADGGGRRGVVGGGGVQKGEGGVEARRWVSTMSTEMMSLESVNSGASRRPVSAASAVTAEEEA